MNIVEKLRLMQTDHIPELGEAIAEIEHLRREAHAWSIIAGLLIGFVAFGGFLGFPW